MNLIEKSRSKLYDYQNDVLQECLSLQTGALNLQMGAGKCHAIDTKILMFDGSIKLVQDIRIGDIIMGDDSTPRNVLSLAQGIDEMYDIIPIKGDKYTVNQEHILCLKISYTPTIKYLTNIIIIKWINNKLNERLKRFKICDEEEAIIFHKKLHQLEIVEISVKDYLKLPNSIKKNILKGYRTSIQFTKVELPLDPYMIGYWLGDGRSNTSSITSQDSTIINYFQHNLQQYKCYLQYRDKYDYRINGDGSGNYNCNHFLNTLKNLNLLNNKHIPHIYKCNSRENQLKLLAGILDADGHLSKNGGFEFTQCIEHEQIIDDVIYLCRSLGFACYKNIKKTSWTHKGVKKYGEAWRISISGEGIEEIPTLCPRKKALPRQQIKNVLVSGIDVKSIGIGNYYGFTLDGNGRFVLGDFTVTHNTVCSLVLALEQTRDTELPIIVIVSKTLIFNWIAEIKKFFGDELDYVVLHKDYNKDIENFKLRNTKLVITTPAVTSKYYKENSIDNVFINYINETVVTNGVQMPRRVKEYLIPTTPYISVKRGGNVIYGIQWGCLIVDEIQEHCNISSITCCSISAICSNYRWGLSGTLFNEPKLERIMGYFIMINNLDFPRRIDHAESYVKSHRFTGYMPTVVHREGISNFVKPKINKIIVQHKLTDNEIHIYVSLKTCLTIINRHIQNLTRNSREMRTRYSSYLLALITYLRQMIVCPLLPITNCMLDSIDLNNDSELSELIINEFKKLNLDDYLNDENAIYSSRIRKINEIVDSIPNKKIIIFTCFKTNLDIMVKTVAQNREKYALNANMSITARASEIEKFKNSHNSILFLTYKLGSEGLNLQFCDTILFADMYWNIGKINQAEARVIRPGQLSKTVDLYYLISNTAIEKGILEKHNDKLVIIDEIKNGSMKTQIRTLKTADIIKILDDENNVDIYSSNLHYQRK